MRANYPVLIHGLVRKKPGEGFSGESVELKVDGRGLAKWPFDPKVYTLGVNGLIGDPRRVGDMWEVVQDLPLLVSPGATLEILSTKETVFLRCTVATDEIVTGVFPATVT